MAVICRLALNLPAFSFLKKIKTYPLINFSIRKLSAKSKMKGLVLGAFTKPTGSYNEVSRLTAAAEELDSKLNGNLKTALNLTGPFYKSMKYKLLYSIPEIGKIQSDGITYDCVTVVDMGAEDAKQDELEERDQKLENIRRAMSEGIRAITSSGIFEDIYLDSCGYPQCVAEVAALTLFCYDELKQKSSQMPKSSLHMFNCGKASSDEKDQFSKGIVIGESQNFGRRLMDTPANLMTPTIFASTISKKLSDTGVKVVVRDLPWIEEQKMGSFLSVTRGSDEPPKFIELHYQGAPQSDKVLAFVGKGITFDSGGISLKPSLDMHKMKADMGGAACVCSSIYAAATLKLKVNIKGYIPLCENLPGGRATKPGDVVFAMNGKSIQVDNTDAEGRLVLADALCYAQKFSPYAILDMATLTGAIIVALGSAATGVYSTDQHLWELLHKAGYETGDRVWRMPLFSCYDKEKPDCIADVNNVSKCMRLAGSCTAAGFLKEFVAADQKWMHLDIAGVMENHKEDVPYTTAGMSGRPCRTIVEFLKKLSTELQ